MKLFANPNFIYIGTFTIPFIFYNLGWSTLYPNISFELLIFYVITFTVCLFGGYILNKMLSFKHTTIPVSRYNKYIVVFINFFFVIDCLYAGQIPLLAIASGAREYEGGQSFGIPTIHVLMVTFTLFYALYIFHQYISNKKRSLFLLFLFTLFPFVLLLQRSNIMYLFIGATYISMLSLKSIKLKRVIFLSVFSLLFIYVFGYLGNLRSGNGDSTFIPRMSGVTNQFLKGPVPNEFYWGYLYIASPVASLQNNINIEQNPKFDFQSFAVYELLPDFLTKNAHVFLDVKPRQFHQLNSFLNVGTMYANSFSYLSWYGMYMMFFYVMFLMNLYYIISSKLGKYRIVAMALMFNLIAFSNFSNAIQFSAFSIQLIYPILFSAASQLRSRKKALDYNVYIEQQHITTSIK